MTSGDSNNTSLCKIDQQTTHNIGLHSLPTISSLPDSLLLNISSYSSPPDVYNLVQTCSSFHRPSVELSDRHILSTEDYATRASRALRSVGPVDPSPSTGAERPVGVNTEIEMDAVMTLHQLNSTTARQRFTVTSEDERSQPLIHRDSPPHDTNNEVKNIATRLINQSMIVGLVCALKRSNASLSLEQAQQLARLQMNEKKKGLSVLLAGSTLVQAVTGRRFDNFDLDIYCTRESLPALRRLLTRDFGLCCESAFPEYGTDRFTSNPLVCQSIHHVEKYVKNTDTVATWPAANVSSLFFQANMARGNPGILNDNLVSDLFLNSRNNYIHRLQRYKKYRFPPSFPITKKTNGNGPKVIDIIVCNHTPEQVIAQFDLDICKTRFDGDKVQINSHIDAFNLRTKVDDFNELTKNYIPYLLDPSPSNPFTNDSSLSPLSLLKEGNVTNKMLLYIMHCFLKTAALNHCNLPNLTSESNDADQHWVLTSNYFIHLHNKTLRRLDRLKKYHDRGIDMNYGMKATLNFVANTPAPKRQKIEHAEV